MITLFTRDLMVCVIDRGIISVVFTVDRIFFAER
jgi:hypothetical protein